MHVQVGREAEGGEEKQTPSSAWSRTFNSISGPWDDTWAQIKSWATQAPQD